MWISVQKWASPLLILKDEAVQSCCKHVHNAGAFLPPCQLHLSPQSCNSPLLHACSYHIATHRLSSKPVYLHTHRHRAVPSDSRCRECRGRERFSFFRLALSVPGHPLGCLLANPGQQEAFTLFQVILNTVLDSYSYGKLQGSQHHLMAWLAMEVEGLDALFVHCRNISPQRMLFWSCKIQTLPKPSARFSAVLPLPFVFYFLVKDAVLFGGCNSVIGH